MADGKGKQTLANMWASPLRLEHDLEDTDVGNPVIAWLENAQTENGVSARAWGTYRPENKLVGVSRSYASYLSNQRFLNILRVALLGAQLHDMDIANCHPMCIVVGILWLGLDPQEV